jgi:hypothetical protein
MMVIFIFFLIRLLFVATLLILLFYILKSPQYRQILNTMVDGIKEGLKASGFWIGKKTYSVELYKWMATDDEDVCEDCLERSSWEPMDIADWMKEGLPRTQEAETECGQKCRCHLVLYKSKIQSSKLH